MKKRLTAVAATALVGAALMTGCFTPETPDVEAPVFSDAAATLSLSGAIDKKSEANRISPDLFGLFLEDINYASFALDDNLLINSSFENRQSLSDGKLHGWSADGAQLSCVQGGVFSRGMTHSKTRTAPSSMKITCVSGRRRRTPRSKTAGTPSWGWRWRRG